MEDTWSFVGTTQLRKVYLYLRATSYVSSPTLDHGHPSVGHSVGLCTSFERKKTSRLRKCLDVEAPGLQWRGLCACGPVSAESESR